MQSALAALAKLDIFGGGRGFAPPPFGSSDHPLGLANKKCAREMSAQIGAHRTKKKKIQGKKRLTQMKFARPIAIRNRFVSHAAATVAFEANEQEVEQKKNHHLEP